jgi:HNH endonuclease
VLTRNAISEVAHIYPYSRSATGSLRLNFWDILKRFWSVGRIRKWRNVIFPDDSPDKGVETCYNHICLSPDAHAYWTKAYFALKPIQLSEDKKRLDVEFHWMPRYKYSSKVDILTSPESSEGFNGNIMLFHFPTDRRVCSGDTISLTTDDPVTRPLPHLALEMHWTLRRMAAMSGAAGIDFDNDDDDSMVLRDPCREDEWDSNIEDESRNSYEEES